MSPALLQADTHPAESATKQRELLLTLSDALHDMSQPLTSVVFAIELSGLDDNDESRRMMLSSARTECNRVLEQVANMRVVCEELLHTHPVTEVA